MEFQFGVRATDKHDGEVAVIEAKNLKEAKKQFAEMFPEDVHNVEVITSDNGYEEFPKNNRIDGDIEKDAELNII